jgi:hypothetical protein
LLLDHVSKFVGDQLLSGRCVGLVVPRAKYEMGARRIGHGADGLRRFRRLVVGMNPYVPKIMPEARLEKIAHRRIERAALRAQHGMNNGRRVVRYRIAGAQATCLYGTSARRARSAATTAVSALGLLHDSRRNPLGVPLVLAAGRIDGKFFPKGSRS